MPAGTTQIITYYSEAVEIDFSSLKIYDSNGNQIDNQDTAYNNEESSLVVTTPPLEDGVYTVASKVLSKIDGHLVQAAIVFGVGDVRIDSSLLESQEQSETTFIPESVARFPGLVGQTIVLGGVIASIAIWSTRKTRFGDQIGLIQDSFKTRFSKIIGFGVVAVFASNFIMLAIRDSLSIFKKPIIELHISNIYKRENFRHKSLISDIASGGIFGLGTNSYILAINSMQELL